MDKNEYVLHIEFDEIEAEIEKLRAVDNVIAGKVSFFVRSLKDASDRIEPTLRRAVYDEKDERELWDDYKLLQREKLAVLDLFHEWAYLEQTVAGFSRELDFQIKDAIEELRDHIDVLAESHRAHIDILEIYNTRKIEILALVITVIISYLAVWEFFVHDLLTSIVFPYDLSPDLNYILVLITLMPVFVTVVWAWVKRKAYI